MAMLAKINQEAYDKLDDSFKAEYKKQDDGTFILDVTAVDGHALEDISGLKSSLSKTLEREKAGIRKLKEFEGIDPTKARDAIGKIDEMANWTPEQKVKEQIEAITKQLAEKHAGEIGDKETAVATLKTQLEKVLIEANAIKAITENKGSVELLLPHVMKFTRMRKSDNGEFISEVIDAEGNVRISMTSGSTANMAISEMVAEMKSNSKLAPAFEGSGATGSGATGTGGTGGTGNRSSYDDLAKLSPAERINQANKQGIKK